MLIKDIITQKPHTIPQETTLINASDYMALEKIRNLPVVDKDNKLTGLITLREIIDAWAHDARKTLVQEAMIKQITTVESSFPLKGAIEMMVASKYSCLPVTEADKILIGFISESDLLKHLVTQVELKHDTKCVREIMNGNPPHLDENESLGNASLFMKQNRIRNLPVVDKDKKLVGLLTLREIINVLSLTGDIENVSIKSGMLKQMTTIEAGTLLKSAVENMFTNHYGCLPVIDNKNKKLIGNVSEYDLLKTLYSMLKVPQDFFAERLGKYFT